MVLAGTVLAAQAADRVTIRADSGFDWAADDAEQQAVTVLCAFWFAWFPFHPDTLLDGCTPGE